MVHGSMERRVTNMNKGGMLKRVLCLMMALLLTSAFLPGVSPALAAEEGENGKSVYTAAIGDDQTVKVGEEATVSVTVDSESAASYNALDMTITYDAEKLELATTEIDGFTVRAGSGSVRVLRYGPAREVGKAFDLTFRCLAEGESQVRITSAKADESANAVDADTPEIDLTDDAAVLSTEITPVFKTHSLTLSGQIGVNFFLELPEIDGVDYADSYVEFTISGKGGKTFTDPYDPNFMNESKKYYGFTCCVSSIQMADTITATFHYDDGKTVSEEYSIAEYIEMFEERRSLFDEKTTAMIESIADYGHYIQIYLSDVNEWTIGTDYAEMERHYTESYDYADVLANVESNAIVRTIAGSNVEKVNYRLQLWSETTLQVFLKTKDGSAPTGVTVTIDELASGKTTTKTVTPARQSDGRYLVQIAGISAHRLGDTVTIKGEAGGAFTVKVSPMSYVFDVLTYNTDTKSRDGVSSLYGYYKAVFAYRTKN